MVSSTFHQIQKFFLNWNVLYAVLFEKQMYNSGNFNGKNRWIMKKVMVLKKLLPHLATRGTYSPGDWRCDEAWCEQTLVYPPVMCQQRLIYCTWELNVMSRYKGQEKRITCPWPLYLLLAYRYLIMSSWFKSCNNALCLYFRSKDLIKSQFCPHLDSEIAVAYAKLCPDRTTVFKRFKMIGAFVIRCTTWIQNTMKKKEAKQNCVYISCNLLYVHH